MIRFLKSVTTALNRVDHFLWGTGSWSLRPHEELLVTSAINHLDEKSASLCRAQLDKKFFIERSNPRINVIHHQVKRDDLRLDIARFGDSLFRVRFRIGQTTETANVTFYRGFLFSIETKRPGASYRDQNMEVLGVKTGMAHETMTTDIDGSEHDSGDGEL